MGKNGTKEKGRRKEGTKEWRLRCDPLKEEGEENDKVSSKSITRTPSLVVPVMCYRMPLRPEVSSYSRSKPIELLPYRRAFRGPIYRLAVI